MMYRHKNTKYDDLVVSVVGKTEALMLLRIEKSWWKTDVGDLFDVPKVSFEKFYEPIGRILNK